jgi:beta-N-acetylhexosaminidase
VRKQTNVVAVTALGLAVFALAGAGRVDGQGEAGKADIRGAVTAVNPADAGAKQRGLLGSVRIEGAKEKTTEYDKAVVRVTAKTKIERVKGKGRAAAGFNDLKKGAKVQAVFTGPVAESYPVQATAKEILILEEAK